MSTGGLPLSDLIAQSELLGTVASALSPAAEVLDRLFYEDVSVSVEPDRAALWLSLIIDGQLGFDLPGGFAIKLGADTDVTEVLLWLRVTSAGVAVGVDELAVALEIPPSLLKPAAPADGSEPPDKVQLVIEGNLVLDEPQHLRVEGFDSVSLPRSLVGDTSIVVSATDVAIDTSHGLTLGEARIELPKDLPALAPEDLVLDNAVIGPAGFSGKLQAQYTPQFDATTKQFTGRGAGELGGVPFAFSSISIELRDNDLVDASLAGQLLLPFFEKPTDVTIELHRDGSFSVDAGGSALGTLEREGLLRLSVTHLGFAVVGGKLEVHTGGTVTLLVGGATWPGFTASDVVIDSHGNIAVHGAGLVLEDGKPLPLGAPPVPGASRVSAVRLDKLDVSGNPLDDGLVADGELSTAAKLGPFSAVIEQLGVHTTLRAPAIAADLSLRPPARVEIDVSTNLVEGGGFLAHDATTGRYAGGLELRVKRLRVAALGLLEHGDGGWSMLASLSAQFPGIPLGFGFFLDGVGGVLGLGRRADADRLRAGLRDHTLDGVLFPEQLGQHGLEMISRVAVAFPAAPGRTLIGPMAKIGWSTPRLATAEIAIVFELPDPIRVLLLAQLHARLPTDDHAIVNLNVDALGVLELGEQRASIDASLHDSKIAGYDISGDLAARIGWGQSKLLVVSVGGFHPAFEVPAGFPALRRLSLAIGTNPRLTCDAYMAVTANTVQFGARAQLVLTKSGFSLDGGLGFDALIQRDPFQFQVDVTAWASIKWHGTTLAGVRVDGTLWGPQPLRAKGKASFDVLWFSVSVDFDETIGTADPAPLPPPPDPAELVRTRLADPASWWVDGASALVHLASGGDGLQVEPQGALAVKQEYVPLERTITRVGAVKLGGPAKVSLRQVRAAGTAISVESLDGNFAPAQFIEMSDADKLAAPAFVAMPAGARLATDDARHGAGRRNIEISYATRIVDPDYHEPPSQRPLSPAVFDALLDVGAAGRATSATGSTRPPRLAVTEPAWAVATAADLTPVTPPTDFVSARQALASARAAGTNVVLVGAHEVP